MSEFPWWCEPERADPLAWTIQAGVRRLGATVALLAAWIGATLLYLGFWAGGMGWGREILVGFVSILGLFATVVVLWLAFGIQVSRRWMGS